MSEDSPYPPPVIEVTGNEHISPGDRLADRWTRLNAALIDGFISMCTGSPILYMLRFWNDVPPEQQRPLVLEIAPSVVGLVGLLLIHGYLLKKYGQTVGKYLMGIRIADPKGSVPAFARLILLRYVPITVAATIPIFGGFFLLADVLFIFRRDRRCLHDLLAGTKVVNARNSD